MATQDPPADDQDVAEAFDELDPEDKHALVALARKLGLDDPVRAAKDVATDRRTFLGGLTGAASAGYVAYGAGKAQAQSGNQAGTIGTQDGPMDIYGEDLFDPNGNSRAVSDIVSGGGAFTDGDSDGIYELPNADDGIDVGSVETGEETLADGTVLIRYNAAEGDETSGVITEMYQSVQAALNALPTGAGRTSPGSPDTDSRAFGHVEILPVDDAYLESFDITSICVDIRGYGQASSIIHDGSDHTIDIDINDVFIQDLAVDHIGSGSFDAIRTSGNFDEIQLLRVSVDSAPRYAFNINDKASHLIGCEASGGGTAAYRFNASQCHGVGLKLTNTPATGVLFDTNATNCNVSGVIHEPGGPGVRFNGQSVNSFQGVVRDGDGDGVVMDGNNSLFSGLIFGNGGDGLEISGASNLVLGHIGGQTTGIRLTGTSQDSYILARCGDSITIESGATQNVINGLFKNQTITDNGTRTLINSRGTNSGDPNSTGDWNGHAAYALQQNATIEDTSNNSLYKPLSDGSWSQIGT